MRTIYLAALERRVSLGAYVRAVKLAKAHPDAEFKHTLMKWWPGTGAEIVREFLDGVMERINDGVPYRKRGVT